MMNYEDCWGIFVPIALLSNPPPPFRATGGSYLKTFQISIKKNSRDQRGQKQSKAEGKGKLKAKKREVREVEHSTKAGGKKRQKRKGKVEANSTKKEDRTDAKEGTQKRIKLMLGRIQGEQPLTHLTAAR